MLDDATRAAARQCALFDELTDAELASVLDTAEVRTVGDGEFIVREGDVDTDLYIIAQGRVRISQRSAGDAEKTLALLDQWDFFGELGLAAGLPRTADARAAGDAQLLRLTQQWLFDLLETGNAAGGKLCLALLQLVGPRLRQTNTELVTLYAAGRLMSTETDVDRLLHRMVEVLVGATTAKSGGVLLLNPTTNTLDGAASYGYDDAAAHENWSEECGAGAASQALQRGATLVIEDWNADARTKELPVTGYECVTSLIVPLLVKDEPLGVFVLGDKMDQVGEYVSFRTADRVLVEGIAGMTAAGIQNARIFAELREQEKLRRKYIGQQ